MQYRIVDTWPSVQDKYRPIAVALMDNSEAIIEVDLDDKDLAASRRQLRNCLRPLGRFEIKCVGAKAYVRFSSKAPSSRKRAGSPKPKKARPSKPNSHMVPGFGVDEVAAI